jgi:hypothetical protein
MALAGGGGDWARAARPVEAADCATRMGCVFGRRGPMRESSPSGGALGVSPGPIRSLVCLHGDAVAAEMQAE